MELVFASILTVFATLLPPAAVLKGLRRPLYGTHLALVAAGLYVLNREFYGQTEIFAPALWLPLACLHVLSINCLTYLAYYMDKRASRRGGWRVPERTLHHMALIGGSPAALLAQRQLRHKTSKKSFRRVFWAIAMLQLACIAALILY